MPIRTPLMLDATVIISSRDRRGLLRDTIESILAGEDLPSELIVVDQSSEADPELARRQCARGCEIRYVPTATRGVSRGRNLGIAQARRKLIALTDDDIQVTPTWLGALVCALQAAGATSVVTGQVLAEETEDGSFAPSTNANTEPRVYTAPSDVDVLYTGNMVAYRSTLLEIGPFDERLGPGTHFPAAEDNDFGLRLFRAGYRIVYAPEALVYHRAWRPADAYLSVRYRYSRGQGAFYAKHALRGDRGVARRMLRDIARHSMHAAVRVRRERPLAAADAVTALGLMLGAAEWLLTYGRQ